MTATHDMREPNSAVRSPPQVTDVEHCALLRHLPPEQIEALLRDSEVRTLAPGDTLLRAGQSNHALYLILEGRLQLHLHRVDGQPDSTLEAGDSAGADSLLDHEPCAGQLIAAQPSRVLEVSEDTFWRLLGASHAFALNLLLTLTERLRSNNDAMRQSAQLRERFERAALFDPLTSCHNRRWLDITLPRIVERHTRDHRRVTLVLASIDDFEQLMARFGIEPCEQLISAMSIQLRSRLRPGDQIARYQPSAFAIVLHDADSSAAAAIVPRLRDAARELQPRTPVPQGFPHVRVSIAAETPSRDQSAAALMALCEAALHRERLLGAEGPAAG